MLDRSVAPQIKFDPSINNLEYNTIILNNSIPVYSISDQSQAVVGIQIVYASGTLAETTKGASYFSTQLLKSGTKEHDANFINDFLELRGAFVQLQSGFDHNSISLYCLSEKLTDILPFFIKLFKEPDFPQTQIEKLQKKKTQEIRINEEKSNYWASKLLKESLFGGHPYGYSLSVEDVNSISRDAIARHWEKISSCNIEFITVAGDFDSNLLKGELEALSLNKNNILAETRNPQITLPAQSQVKKLAKSEQTSLKIGMPSISLTHPDYPALSLGNTIWGGYFGSRLMQTIREKKGLTYGIRSSFIHLMEVSYLQISADLKKGAGNETIELVKSELNLLTNKQVGQDELDRVKSFMIGEYKSSTETIFDKMSKVKFIKLHQLPDSYFVNLYNNVLETSSERVLKVVEHYIKTSDFHTVIVE